MEREQLTASEKYDVMESLIDRSKINKKSKFNKKFKQANDFYWEDHMQKDYVISAELYTRQEAMDILYQELKEDNLVDYGNDIDFKETVDNRNKLFTFSYVIKRYSLEDGDIRRGEFDCSIDKICNLHKPVYILRNV